MMAKRITAISYELMADEYNRFPGAESSLPRSRGGFHNDRFPSC